MAHLSDCPDENGRHPRARLRAGPDDLGGDPMSGRRASPTWAATSVPEIRQRWCNSLDAVAHRFSDVGLAPPAPFHDRASAARRRQMQDQLAAQLRVMQTETAALRDAELFWVTRPMVDFIVEAALSLPEWTPALAIPCPNGLLCWAKPAGLVPLGAPGSATADVNWDGVWWWTRPDGFLQLAPASRFAKHADLLKPYQVTTPLWAATSIVVDPRANRTAEANGSEDAHPFISVVGATWLLMNQASTQTRTLSDPFGTRLDEPTRQKGSGTTLPAQVTLVDIRHSTEPANPSESTDESNRQYSHRWWVRPHWRQQAKGPNRSLREPKWIGPHIKGPGDAPLIEKPRVNVLRR